jgi:hypothetical protein
MPFSGQFHADNALNDPLMAADVAFVLRFRELTHLAHEDKSFWVGQFSVTFWANHSITAVSPVVSSVSQLMW